jgi:glutathione S-transferase
MTMQLYGNYVSPYVRRVAVSMHMLGIPFELKLMMASSEPEKVRDKNPMTRIPTLVDEDGGVMVDSWAIVDSLDHMVPPEQRLIPAYTDARRRVMNITAIALSVMEKAQVAYYEERFHEEAKRAAAWLERADGSALAGLALLDEIAAEAGAGWLAGTDRISQADISAAVAFGFVPVVRSELDLSGYTHLAEFAARCEALPAFRACAVPEDD